ncbi:MAG: hypothetical protein ACYTG0_20980 [Planctomycetota bacterium]
MKVDITNSRTFACLLSVVMFLTAAPPVWTHCHQDCSLGYEECCGDQQETRADDDTCCGDHAARCSVELKHRRDGAESHCWAIGCNRNVSHYHLAWLGMTARAPVHKQSKQLNDESQHTALLHEAFVPLKESGSSSCIESPVDLKASNVIGHVSPQLGDRTDLPPDTLLCDVARRERTGVLVV